MTLTTAETLRAHRAYCQMAGFRPSSIMMRTKVLEFLAKHLEPRSLLEATKVDLQEFLTQPATPYGPAYQLRPTAPATRRAYRSHVRALFSWALDEGYIDTDPARKLPAVKVPSGAPRPITSADLRTALDAANPKMRAWLLLGAFAGLRCLEIAALRPGDIVATDAGPVLRLRVTKGGHEGVDVPAHPEILAALACLPVRNGCWWDCQTKNVSAKIGQFLRSVGVEATAHQLRHFAGTAWYRASGQDIIATARLLRHASIKSTQIYAGIDPSRTADVVNSVQLADGEALPLRLVDGGSS
jgi:integrase